MGDTLSGKVAIVTGAASGIGAATAAAFVREGARVAIADRDFEQGERVSRELGTLRGRTIFVETHVDDAQSVDAMVAKVVEELGPINVLVNNAGIDIRAGLVHEIDECTWGQIMWTNAKGAFLCSKACIPYMIQAGGGAIVNNSSLMAELAFPGAAAYCSSKAALIGLTTAMAIDLAPHRIRVNAVQPGSIDTPLMWSGVSKEDINKEREDAEGAIPLGRLGKPEEVAEVILFLSSDAAAYMTGSKVTIDGGLGARLAVNQ